MIENILKSRKLQWGVFCLALVVAGMAQATQPAHADEPPTATVCVSENGVFVDTIAPGDGEIIVQDGTSYAEFAKLQVSERERNTVVIPADPANIQVVFTGVTDPDDTAPPKQTGYLFNAAATGVPGAC